MEKILKTQVYNLVILDKSGSMKSIRKEAINGFNETLGSVKAAQLKHAETQDHYISLITFCGCSVEDVYDKVSIVEAEKLTMKDYEPCCMTPLFDAIGKTVKKLRHDIKDIEDAAVLVTIITDGYENASIEWTWNSIKALINECKEDGWMFSFIGAGEDVVKVASTISITNTVVWEQTKEGTEHIFANENAARERYYDKMEFDIVPCADVESRKEARKRFSEEFYKLQEEIKKDKDNA